MAARAGRKRWEDSLKSGFRGRPVSESSSDSLLITRSTSTQNRLEQPPQQRRVPREDLSVQRQPRRHAVPRTHTGVQHELHLRTQRGREPLGAQHAQDHHRRDDRALDGADR